MRPFLVCVHDATPAFDRETRIVVRDLAPLIGRRFSFGVVPDWCGRWPLAAHPDYCRLLEESSRELLLHGYVHQRCRGWGPVSWLTEGGDEMNGLDPAETRCTLERGQQIFTEVFGAPARGFLAPAWQPGHVDSATAHDAGLQHILGFFSVESYAGRIVPLTTWSWHCGRWRWPGRVGSAIGWLLQSVRRGVPSVAIHPRDLERGFWPEILRLIRQLLETGHEPGTLAGVLQAEHAEVVF